MYTLVVSWLITRYMIVTVLHFCDFKSLAWAFCGLLCICGSWCNVLRDPSVSDESHTNINYCDIPVVCFILNLCTML